MQTAKFAQLLPLAAGVIFLEATSAQAGTNLDLARQLNQAFVEVAQNVSPSVVVITVTEKAAPASGMDAGDDSLDFLPPQLRRRLQPQFENMLPDSEQSQGSGVIIRTNGYILTNRHVVENAERIEVRLLDGRTFNASVRGVDPGSDVAVIKIDAGNLAVARFADSSKTRVGEFAIAIGAPFAYDYSITFGHVSAKGRSNVVPAFDSGATIDQDFIQTDANINPGNSGGPLLNIEGEVIGINTVIRGLHTGIGFAIPSNLAREVSDKLIADGKFTRAWLGIEVYSVKDDPAFRELFQGVDDGVIVKSILPNGPCATSDLRTSDVITAVDGRSVGTPQQLRNEVRGKAVGRAMTVDVFRGGKSLKLKINPGEYVDPTLVSQSAGKTDAGMSSTGLGLTVHPLTRELAERFGAHLIEGVIVVSVDSRSPAARHNIKPGDIITSVITSANHTQTVTSPKQFTDALEKADLKKGVIVNLVSGDMARFELLKENGD